MTQPCAIVAPGPMSTGMPGGACSTQQSCTLAPSRTMIGREVGAQHGVEPHRCTRLDVHVADQRGGGGDEGGGIDVGDRPSNENSGMV